MAIRATLLMGTSSSYCGACKKSADPDESGHFTQLGYGPENGTPGCGAWWDSVHLTTVYSSTPKEKMVPRLKEFYPSLKDIPLDRWTGFHGDA